MFYLIVGVLLAIYYIFAAPKTIKGTLNTVLVVGVLALCLVLGVLGLIKVMQSPPEIFVGLLMTILGVFTLRDVEKLSPKNKG
ncbi:MULTISPECIES: DUF3165 family protein [unclassified Streptococcus]|uniref:DUF3165 family protein n=1 Tax=unclassified Streptococcus TaxID=2608887 RepID=UPI00359CCD1C